MYTLMLTEREFWKYRELFITDESSARNMIYVPGIIHVTPANETYRMNVMFYKQVDLIAAQQLIFGFA